MKPAPQSYTATVIRKDPASDGWLTRALWLKATDIAEAVSQAKAQVEADNNEILWSVTPERSSQVGWLSSEQVHR